MTGSRLLAAVLLLCCCCPVVRAWDDMELEIFDVVEEVNQNFYDYMGIDKDASSTDVRKAYRQLSLVLHPDKNSAEDADVKFRWLVAIYEILKDPARREIYNRVLVEGLPNWRSPVYYYRRMRKMGLAEGMAYVLVIVTICQYFVNWAAYLEKKFTIQEALNAHSRKMMKKVKKGKGDEAVNAVLETHEENMLGPKPSCYDTLPFQIFRGCKYLAFAIPALPSNMYGMYRESKERKQEEERLMAEEEEERQRQEEVKKERKEQKAKRKKVERYDDRTGEKRGDSSDDENAPPPPVVDVFKQPANALQLWTDQDLAKLARLMKKFPAGTQERWERIAETMERLTWEVTKMARKVKDVAYQVPISKSAQGVTGLEEKKMIRDDCMEYQSEDTEEEEEDEESETDDDDEEYGSYSVATKEAYVPVEVKEKKKTKGGKAGGAAAASGVDGEEGSKCEDVAAPEAATVAGATEQQWSQQQQKTLESALTTCPKGTAERWDRIASKVPGKSKEQCMQRFKELAEIVKKKKMEEERTD